MYLEKSKDYVNTSFGKVDTRFTTSFGELNTEVKRVTRNLTQLGEVVNHNQRALDTLADDLKTSSLTRTPASPPPLVSSAAFERLEEDLKEAVTRSQAAARQAERATHAPPPFARPAA